MNPDQQRIAIAEACPKLFYMHHGRCFLKTSNPRYVYGPPQEADPLNDLNAMHCAEQTLRAEQVKHYCEHLWHAMNGSREAFIGTIHATAAQRAEAFLRTIGKWKDE